MYLPTKSKSKTTCSLLKAGVGIVLISTLSLANDTLLNSDYFLDATIGYNNTAVDRSDKSGTIDIKSIDESGYNINLALGYIYRDNISFTTTYQRVKLDDIHMDNIYLGTEYTLNKIDKFIPYVGANLGYSRLSWDTSPITNVKKSDMKSGSLLLGATAGVTYPVNDRLSLMANYQLELMNHSSMVTIDSAKSELDYKLSHNINFGIRYYFSRGVDLFEP